VIIVGTPLPTEKAKWTRIHETHLPERKKVEFTPATEETQQTQQTQQTPAKKKGGRPKGSVKMTIQRYANNPPKVLPKTDHQRLKELKELMIRSGGKDVAQKVIEIALNDDHPGQMAALKMCIDRTLPISMFEKDKGQRSAVTINITGLGQEPTIIDTDAQDVEAKYG
jgi:hypothetical protein